MSAPISPSTDFLLDCKGREIHVGDLLKVFHFVGGRRKRYYMYRLVTERDTLGASQCPAFKLSHLNLNPESYYWALVDGRQLADVEIVQGYGADGTPFDERPKRKPINQPESK